jgi:hypothetical protein
VTKDEFVESFDALSCSLCLEPYDATHVPVELPGCGHVFGDYCIANAVESKTQNNNPRPLCRDKLFEQEDFDENGDWIYDSDDSLEDDEESEEVNTTDEEEEHEEVENREREEMEDQEHEEVEDQDELEILNEVRIAMSYVMMRFCIQGLTYNTQVITDDGTVTASEEEPEADEENIQQEEFIDSEDDEDVEVVDSQSISSDDARVPHSSPSEYHPSDDEGDSDHEQDDQRRAKIRPEDGGVRKDSKASRTI